MLDMIRPAIPGKISLNDLKKCKLTSIFFDTFFNFEKYLDHEQRDPFATARDHDAEGHEVRSRTKYFVYFLRYSQNNASKIIINCSYLTGIDLLLRNTNCW